MRRIRPNRPAPRPAHAPAAPGGVIGRPSADRPSADGCPSVAVEDPPAKASAARRHAPPVLVAATPTLPGPVSVVRLRNVVVVAAVRHRAAQLARVLGLGAALAAYEAERVRLSRPVVAVDGSRVVFRAAVGGGVPRKAAGADPGLVDAAPRGRRAWAKVLPAAGRPVRCRARVALGPSAPAGAPAAEVGVARLCDAPRDRALALCPDVAGTADAAPRPPGSGAAFLRDAVEALPARDGRPSVALAILGAPRSGRTRRAPARLRAIARYGSGRAPRPPVLAAGRVVAVLGFVRRAPYNAC